MNAAYQLSMHFAMHMRQWPKSDPTETRQDIARRLREGNAWLWPEPVQMELFR
ncbi:hypothetical protein [Methyloversatilis sp. XJ19-49]|uniref:hypothetical protein n=1 Tax=Methyloversatilis sp. XJ19-49 TaxID=2963429 RepID=UPI00211D0154|nr:hypothetical protein [Methyloversatilis sp. XJ19-49]MCQ9378825.1 hypothetical protein [Methyloversatilis sp. XJ19-49]